MEGSKCGRRGGAAIIGAVTDDGITTLLLDFGGVCLLNPVELHHVAESALGLAAGTLDWFGPIAPETDPMWMKMAAGEGLTEREYWALRATEVGRLGGRELDVRSYMRLLFYPARPELIRPGCLEVVSAARQAGLGVSVFSNDLIAFHGLDWVESIELLQTVDRVLDCSSTGIFKPDPAAYRWALGELGVEGEAVLFVDDQPVNVAGAEAVGMQAMWFDIADADGSWTKVAERLGLRR